MSPTRISDSIFNTAEALFFSKFTPISLFLLVTGAAMVHSAVTCHVLTRMVTPPPPSLCPSKGRSAASRGDRPAGLSCGTPCPNGGDDLLAVMPMGPPRPARPASCPALTDRANILDEMPLCGAGSVGRLPCRLKGPCLITSSERAAPGGAGRGPCSAE